VLEINRSHRRAKTVLSLQNNSKLLRMSCPQCKGTDAETLKQQRPIGEGDQELEKRLA
jgi:hypothetical protein